MHKDFVMLSFTATRKLQIHQENYVGNNCYFHMKCNLFSFHYICNTFPGSTLDRSHTLVPSATKSSAPSPTARPTCCPMPTPHCVRPTRNTWLCPTSPFRNPSSSPQLVTKAKLCTADLVTYWCYFFLFCHGVIFFILP